MPPDPKLKPGTNYCLCKCCGEYFLSDRGFSRHMTRKNGENACLAPPDMSERGFRHVSKGKFWYWAAP